MHCNLCLITFIDNCPVIPTKSTLLSFLSDHLHRLKYSLDEGYRSFFSLLRTELTVKVSCTKETTFQFIKSIFLALFCLLFHSTNRTLCTHIQS